MHQQVIILYVNLCVLPDVKDFESIYCLFKGLISVQGCNCADTPYTLKYCIHVFYFQRYVIVE